MQETSWLVITKVLSNVSVKSPKPTSLPSVQRKNVSERVFAVTDYEMLLLTLRINEVDPLQKSSKILGNSMLSFRETNSFA